MGCGSSAPKAAEPQPGGGQARRNSVGVGIKTTEVGQETPAKANGSSAAVPAAQQHNRQPQKESQGSGAGNGADHEPNDDPPRARAVSRAATFADEDMDEEDRRELERRRQNLENRTPPPDTFDVHEMEMQRDQERRDELDQKWLEKTNGTTVYLEPDTLERQMMEADGSDSEDAG